MQNFNKEIIFETTVYQDRVLVTRKLEVDLKEIDKSVIFRELPLNVQRDSIRISGQGAAILKIDGIDIQEEYLELYSNESLQKLKEETDALKDELAILNQKMADANSRIGMAKNFLSIHSGRFKEEFYFNKINPESLKKLVQTYRDICLGEISEISANEKKQRELQKKITKLEREMNAKKSSAGKTVLNCPVAVTVTKPGSFCFYLSYVVMNASWYPVYDTRLYVDSQEIEISYYGVVHQNTGEEWNGVKLYLSTAKPSISASLPELSSWFIDFMQYEDAKSKFFAKSEGGKGISGGFGGDGFGGEYDEFDGAPQQQASVSKGLSVTFGIQDGQDLPPDGTEKKVLILRKKFPVEMSYRSYPMHTQAVFIIGSVENTTEMPFLAGTVKVYHDQDYIGDSYINNILPGEKALLSLGADDNVKIKREKLKGFRQKKGLTGGYEKIEYKYRITVNNYKNNPIQLKIEESIPLSKNKELKVETTDIIPKAEPNEKGILNWDIPMEKGQEKVLEINYNIEYPKSKTVTGLDEW